MLVLQETLRAVFYAPLYAALSLGVYEEEGVDVEFKSAGLPSQAAEGLFDGTVDVMWGGPLRVIKVREQRPDSDLVCFCEIVTRDPFFLVGRESRPDFTVNDLAGMRVSVVSEVPTPWLCLQEDIRRAGLNPDMLCRVSDLSMADNVTALRRGDVDVIQTFSPFVDELLAEGVGHLLYAAASRGLTSYTTFYAAHNVLKARHHEFRLMVRALYRVQKWLDKANASEIVQAIVDYFPSVPTLHLVSAIDRYQQLGIWGKNPHLLRPGFERLRAGMISGGFVHTASSYEDAVDNFLADAAIHDDPPAWKSF